MEGSTRDCGEGWRVMSTPLECSHAVTAVDFAPTTSPDKRCVQEHVSQEYTMLESVYTHYLYVELTPRQKVFVTERVFKV